MAARRGSRLLVIVAKTKAKDRFGDASFGPILQSAIRSEKHDRTMTPPPNKKTKAAMLAALQRVFV
jgi:hypothetical protein